MRFWSVEEVASRVASVLPRHIFPLALCDLISLYAASIICWTVTPRYSWRISELKLAVTLRAFQTDSLNPLWTRVFDPLTEIYEVVGEQNAIFFASNGARTNATDPIPKEKYHIACPLGAGTTDLEIQDVSSLYYSRCLERFVILESSLIGLQVPGTVKLTLVDPVNAHSLAPHALDLVDHSISDLKNARIAPLNDDGRFLALTRFTRSSDRPTKWIKSRLEVSVFDLHTVRDGQVICCYGPYQIDAPDHVWRAAPISAVIQRNRMTSLQIFVGAKEFEFFITLDVSESASPRVVSVVRDFFILFDSERAVIPWVPFDGDEPSGPPVSVSCTQLAEQTLLQSHISFDNSEAKAAALGLKIPPAILNERKMSFDNKSMESRELRRVSLLRGRLFSYVDKSGSVHVYRYDLNSAHKLAQFNINQPQNVDPERSQRFFLSAPIFPCIAADR
jgi:hypothetical protein